MPSRRRRLPRVILAATVAALAACTPDAAQERALGAEAAAQYDAQLALVRDPALTGYLQALGDSLVRVADPDGGPYRFALVNSADINAFALPGGFIYVNRGLVERVASRDELASVLAHEIGHVVHRHGVDQMVARQRTGIGMTIVCFFVDVCSTGIAQVAIEVGGSALFAKYGRDDEREADADAVTTLAAAGMDPRAVPAMLWTLKAAEQRDPTLFDAMLGSHPLTAERVERTQRAVDSVLAARGAPSAGAPRDDAAFARIVTRLRALPAPPSVRALP